MTSSKRICVHGIQLRNRCIECGRSSSERKGRGCCVHGIQHRTAAKLSLTTKPEKKKLCRCGKRLTRCPKCKSGGGSLCEHGRRRDRCSVFGIKACTTRHCQEGRITGWDQSGFQPDSVHGASSQDAVHGASSHDAVLPPPLPSRVFAGLPPEAQQRETMHLHARQIKYGIR